MTPPAMRPASSSTSQASRTSVATSAVERSRKSSWAFTGAEDNRQWRALIVLHGGYLPATPSASSGGFALWGEGLFTAREGRERHPRALSATDLEAALKAEGL